jgi:hypothetical protein
MDLSIGAKLQVSRVVADGKELKGRLSSARHLGLGSNLRAVSATIFLKFLD